MWEVIVGFNFLWHFTSFTTPHIVIYVQILPVILKFYPHVGPFISYCILGTKYWLSDYAFWIQVTRWN